MTAGVNGVKAADKLAHRAAKIAAAACEGARSIDDERRISGFQQRW